MVIYRRDRCKMIQLLFIVHGRLRKSRSWNELQKAINEEVNISFDVFFTEYPKHAIELVECGLSSQTYSAVIACGGDGTLNECVNGIVKTDSKIPVGVIAMGTGNDFVKSLGLKGVWSEIKFALENNHIQSIDLIKLNNKFDERYGINVTDIGFGGEVVQRMAKDSRILGPFLTYQLNIIKTFLRFQPKLATIDLDGSVFSMEKLFLLACCNGKWFGSGLAIEPEAAINDGWINLVIVDNISFLSYLLQIPTLRAGKRMSHKSVHYRKAKRVHIVTDGLPVDCDGEFAGYTPMLIEVVENAINILTPG